MIATRNETLVAVTCAQCQIPFGVAAFAHQTLRATNQNFHCPFGHLNHYPAGKTEAEKLREQVKDLQAASDHANQQRMAAEADAQRLRNSQAKLLKSAKLAKKRASAGVCPYCHRTVKQMAAHMKTKHPDYAESK